MLTTLILTAALSAIAAVGVYSIITNYVINNNIRKRREDANKEDEAEG